MPGGIETGTWALTGFRFKREDSLDEAGTIKLLMLKLSGEFCSNLMRRRMSRNSSHRVRGSNYKDKLASLDL